MALVEMKPIKGSNHQTCLLPWKVMLFTPHSSYLQIQTCEWSAEIMGSVSVDEFVYCDLLV